MKKDTTPKKAWQKPEVSDLDVSRTSKDVLFYEVTNASGTQYGPAS
jgi:hypothetical protein